MEELSTIAELDQWMEANCYNDGYAIGKRIIYEGYGLEASDGMFAWFYSERGEKRILKTFRTEKEAIQFALHEIKLDKSANRHLVGFLKDRSSETELLRELDVRGIKCWTDKIPFGGLHDPRYRVFVFGCDIKLVKDLEVRYGAVE
jgi:hypothetical protein